MGGELGTLTNIGLFVMYSAIFASNNFRLDREQRFYFEVCVEMLVFLRCRQYLVEFESKST